MPDLIRQLLFIIFIYNILPVYIFVRSISLNGDENLFGGTQATPTTYATLEPATNGDVTKPVDILLCADKSTRDARQRNLIDQLLMNLTKPNPPHSLQRDQFGRVLLNIENNNQPKIIDCKLELIACASCLIKFSWTVNTFNLSKRSTSQQPSLNVCGKPNDVSAPDCISLDIIEENADKLFSYKTVYNKVPLLFANGTIRKDPSLAENGQNQRQKFITSSYKAQINVHFVQNAGNVALISSYFPIEYTVIDHVIVRKGRPSVVNESDGFIESPRFPRSYPEGVVVNYTLVNQDPTGFVRLTFSDYQVHPMSHLQILDSDGSPLGQPVFNQYNQAAGRPCAVQSSGPTLTLEFRATQYSQEIGFRAHYTFVVESFWPSQPVCRVCDKVFDNKGGLITLDSLDVDLVDVFVDCIWLITKSPFGSTFYDKLYLKIEDFMLGVNGKSIQLEIRRGLTSKSDLVLHLHEPKSGPRLARQQPQDGFVTDLHGRLHLSKDDEQQSGFYVRLRGLTGQGGSMALVYAHFYKWATALCLESYDFHCDNGRCILSQFKCDGNDHCGDFSDETKERCPAGSWDFDDYSFGKNHKKLNDEQRRQSTASSGATSATVLFGGLVGLVLASLSLSLLAAKIYRRRIARRVMERFIQEYSRHQESSDHGQSAGPQMIRQSDNRRLLVLPGIHTSVIEAPPSYDDALKHPTVPPLSVMMRNSNEGIANASFLNDSGQSLLSNGSNSHTHGDQSASSAEITQSVDATVIPMTSHLNDNQVEQSICDTEPTPAIDLNQSAATSTSQDLPAISVPNENITSVENKESLTVAKSGLIAGFLRWFAGDGDTSEHAVSTQSGSEPCASQTSGTADTGVSEQVEIAGTLV